MLLFAISFTQHLLNWVEVKPLKGSTNNYTSPEVSLSSWLSGEYQSKMDKHLTSSFGFREPLVRMVNQLDYTLYHEANARYVVIGKDDFLYETPYIEAHLGMDYLGDSAIQGISTKMKMLKDTLRKLGVDLQLVFAPGKASYFPEYIPDHYSQYAGDTNNYERFKYHFDALGFEYLDLHRWFRTMKDTSTYPLFPITGIHWSKYGMALAVDSILNYWNQKYNDSLPDFHFGFGEISTETQGSDADVEEGLNIFEQLQHFGMMYPTYHFIDSAKKKLQTAVIADSYYWGLFDIGLSTIASDSGEFWYYFKQVYPQHFSNELMINDLDLKQAIESKDVIMLLQTDATLDRFGFGFVEAAWELYFPNAVQE